MTTVKISSNSSTFVADQADTTYVLGEAVTLDVSDTFGIDATSGADNLTFSIKGRIFNNSDGGIRVGTFYGGLTSDDCSITIGKTGLVLARDTAISLYGDSAHISSAGSLLGDTTIDSNGIYLVGNQADVDNSGLIQARFGVSMDGSANVFRNSGTVLSTLAVDVNTATGESAKIVNSGRLLSPDLTAIDGGAGRETVVNSGQIHGDILLLGDDDTFLSRGGHVNGTVYGGAGSDTYIVDNRSLHVFEGYGEGYDRVRASVNWTLGANFEEGALTGRKDLDLVGNDSGDVLYGNSGDNHIMGKMGSDFITGGRGNDTLTGGDGVNGGDIGDIFIFKNHSGADIITDFQDGMDKINLQSYAGIDGFADLTIKKSGGDVIVTLADGDMITLLHTSKAMISDADFQF